MSAATTPVFSGADFLHDEDVALLLQISPGRLRNKIVLGDPLPPRAELPGMRVRLWPRKGVEEWILKFVKLGPLSEPENPVPPIPKRRGRPPKTSRRAQP